jgi:hypothetical protein
MVIKYSVMLKAQPKLGKKKLFLAKHPHCCFCGGTESATTLDHVPPKACFPAGYWPEGFEFPACEACNLPTNKYDQIFGFYAMCVDFSKENRTPAALARFAELKAGILNNYPDALPNTVGSRPIFSTGSIVTPTPLAVEISRPPAFRDAATVIAQKLTHALYYRECGKALTSDHWLLSDFYQPQRSDTRLLTDFFVELLPDQTIGTRSNLRQYGERFAYKFLVREEDDFFVYAAQFGRGLILWGIVLGPGLAVSGLQEPLRSKPWHRGACGLGSILSLKAP